jgi:hypothetical protein
MTVAQLRQIQFRAAILAKEYGFEYSSYVGVHPLGSRGTVDPTARGASDAPHEKTAASPKEPRRERGMDDNAREHATIELMRRAGVSESHAQAVTRMLPPELLNTLHPILSPTVREDGLQNAAALAGLDQEEAAALDRLLRRQPFDAVEALFGYVPTATDPDAPRLRQAIRKLLTPWGKQTAALRLIDEYLTHAKSVFERQALQSLKSAIERQHVAGVLMIRQVFQPDPNSGASASWSTLTKRTGHQMFATARSPIGGEFPVQFENESQERFRIRVTGGDDAALTVTVISHPPSRTDTPVVRDYTLVRDQAVKFLINGHVFSLLYPSSHVRRSSPATSNQAHLFITYLPEENLDRAN